MYQPWQFLFNRHGKLSSIGHCKFTFFYYAKNTLPAWQFLLLQHCKFTFIATSTMEKFKLFYCHGNFYLTSMANLLFVTNGKYTSMDHGKFLGFFGMAKTLHIHGIFLPFPPLMGIFISIYYAWQKSMATTFRNASFQPKERVISFHPFTNF